MASGFGEGRRSLDYSISRRSIGGPASRMGHHHHHHHPPSPEPPRWIDRPNASTNISYNKRNHRLARQHQSTDRSILIETGLPIVPRDPLQGSTSSSEPPTTPDRRPASSFPIQQQPQPQADAQVRTRRRTDCVHPLRLGVDPPRPLGQHLNRPQAAFVIVACGPGCLPAQPACPRPDAFTATHHTHRREKG